MNYLLYGTESFLLEKEKQKLIETYHMDSINISLYDYEQDSLKEILEDAQTTSLFEDKKMIIVDRASLFTGSNKKINAEEDPFLLEEYLAHTNTDTILLFIVRDAKLDERKKIVKRMKQEKVIECNQVKDVASFVKNACLPIPIAPATVSFLINRVGNSLEILTQEIEKLKLYKNGEPITEEDILALCPKMIDTDIFGLIEAIVAKDKEKAMEVYHEFLKQKEEPVKLIVMLANQFRLIYQAKQLYQKGYTEGDIASTLAVHPYRIKLALQKGRGLSNTALLGYLEELADLDTGIKTGKIDKEVSFELFILSC